jgi:hypothetical protein
VIGFRMLSEKTTGACEKLKPSTILQTSFAETKTLCLEKIVSMTGGRVPPSLPAEAPFSLEEAHGKSVPNTRLVTGGSRGIGRGLRSGSLNVALRLRSTSLETKMPPRRFSIR